MLSDKVVTSDEKGVRTITLQRPEKKNALDAEMFEALTHQLSEATADQEVKVTLMDMGIISPQVVVLTGAGEHFSSGNDLGNFLTAVSKGRTYNILYRPMSVQTADKFECLIVQLKDNIACFKIAP